MIIITKGKGIIKKQKINPTTKQMRIVRIPFSTAPTHVGRDVEDLKGKEKKKQVSV